MKRTMGLSRHRLGFAIIVASLFVSTAAIAAVKQIDRRGSSEESNYYIVFCARNDSPTGHAYVALGKDDFDAKASAGRAFGMYPANGKGVLGPVPGRILDDSLTGASERLIVRVNSGAFKKVDQIREKWSKRGTYKLLEQDCVSFVEEVAQVLELKTPPRAEAKFPVTFIAKLLAMND